MVLESSFELDSFNVLLVLNFLLDVLVTLKKFVMFSFSELQTLIKVGLELLLKGVHLILLLLDKLGFSSDDLLMSILHIFFSFFSFQILASDLDLMSFLILLLLGEVILDLLLVEQFSGILEGKRELFLKIITIRLKFKSVFVFQFTESLSIFFLGLKKIVIPLLVELLVLFDVSLFTLFSLLGLVED